MPLYKIVIKQRVKGLGRLKVSYFTIIITEAMKATKIVKKAI